MPPDFLFLLPPAGIFISVLLTVAAVALAFELLMMLRPVREASARFAEITPGVVAVSGALFGLSVTFLANSVWTTEDRARETVNAEARALRVMQVYMDQMTGPSRDGLSRLIADYGTAVSAEWTAMTDRQARSRGEQALRDVYASVIKGFSEGEQNRTLQQRLLTALDTLSAARQQRLSMAQDVVSGGQWFLVTGLGAVLLSIVAMSHAKVPFARRVALCVVTTAASIMLFMIVLHDRPFVGHAAVTPQPILRAAGFMP
ncbi:hypothetical protein [Aestuariivirga sp.]|uniref:bestrophin-like domain n=1 Tax=Aestuariivirga sp. TaxID=2650926 RepID=UPI00391BADA6